MTNKIRAPRDGTAKTILQSEHMPTPMQIKARLKDVSRIYKAIKSVPSVTHAIMGKDPRTIQKYYEALAHCKIAYAQLEEIINILEDALPLTTSKNNSNCTDC